MTFRPRQSRHVVADGSGAGADVSGQFRKRHFQYGSIAARTTSPAPAFGSESRLHFLIDTGTIATVGVVTTQMLREFRDRGYIVVPGLVPEELLVDADREIDELAAGPTPPQEGDGGPGVNAW